MSDVEQIGPGAGEETLRAEIARQNKIIRALMNRAEHMSSSGNGSDYGAFQTRVLLEEEVRRRTEELENALRDNERMTGALRQSEEKFRSLTEVAQDAVIMIDAEGAVVYWNPAAERIFGYSAAEAAGRKIHDWLAPERYRAAAAVEFPEFTKSGRGPMVGKTVELAALRKDGVEIPIELSLAASRTADGWSAIGIARDITKRKRAEEAARASEEKYRGLVESTSDWVWEIDKDSRYTYSSPVVKRLLGYEPRELVGKTPFDIMAPAEAKRVAAAFAPIAATHEPFSLLENTVLRKDGQEVVLETSGSPIFDSGGVFRGYRGIDRNVTAHKLAEKALQRRDALVHAAAASATNLVTMASLDDAIRQSLEMVSSAMHVDRIVVLERSADRGRAPVLRYVWESPRITFKLDKAFFENLPPETADVVAWQLPLRKGRIVTADLRSSADDVRELLERLGVQKILIVPVMVDGKFWGQIGFDSCDQNRSWPDYEIETLQTLAEMIGTAIQQDRYVKELADANRIVQNTPTILYRMRGEPSLPMIYISQNIKLFGHDPAVLTASPLLYRSLIHPADLEITNEAMAHALGGQIGIVEFRMLTSSGEFRWVENHYMPLLDKAGRVVEVEGLLSDITERKAAEEKITRLARTDALTGLANRSTFTERLRELFAASRRGALAFAVLYLDLDRFKDVNDTLGHPIGDRLLVETGERMQRCVRETDLVARIGGDEFAVLQTDLNDPADAGALAAKIRTAIAEVIRLNGNELHMTASIGIALYEADTAAPDDLLAQADLALYRAKEEGRDQYRFHTEQLDVAVRNQVAMAEELRNAIIQGEFELHYQPQVELSTNRIAGMEALVRWNHPKRGLLLPGQFIEIAERTGAITSIGQWVLDTACRQMSQWRAAGLAPLTVAVNVSAIQLKAANEFVELVRLTLEKWHLEPGDLELDVTESMLARISLAQNDVLERLHKMGVRISIDDFGTEYSSLDYLKTYHVNRIKIPRPLLDAAPRDLGSAAIARAIVDIARELNIEVVAEGVENEAEWTFLATKAPVQKVQGYYFSKPVPVDDATALLRRKHIEPRSSNESSKNEL